MPAMLYSVPTREDMAVMKNASTKARDTLAIGAEALTEALECWTDQTT